MKQIVTACLLAGLTAAASAAPVTATLPSGFSLQSYHGSTAVNAGLLDADSVLWTVAEQAHDGLQSWYLFFDPKNPQRLRATVDFGAPIVAVYSSRQALVDSQAAWRVDIDADGAFDDYAWRPLMGLESEDLLSWTPGTSFLSLDWTAEDPGDHVRVLVQAPSAVPEPASLALVLLALGGAALSRRRA